MDTISFKIVDHKVYADKQLVRTFFISRELFERDAFEVMPLTIGNLCFALVRNYAIILNWRLARLAKRMGLLRTPEGCMVDWKADLKWRDFASEHIAAIKVALTGLWKRCFSK